ncbi:MAG TPA: Do family serine endopeptidase [Thermoanaerobaculia bacterium]|nr:Do family serine endopeptidase [Thermoanaerobaculia bacterium]
MTQAMKRNLSIGAIIVASIAFGMIITADFGWLRPSSAQPAPPPIQTTQAAVPTMTIPSFADVAARVMPAVVSITTTEIYRSSERRGREVNPFDFFFPDPRRQQGEEEERRQLSGGSGFIISADGYILTNNHVVEGATSIRVQYGEADKVADAKVIGRDPATDIALIKIEVKEQLPTVTLGDSDAIRVGDWAIAIGNPLQFENTLTVGVISAKNRALGISEATSSFENFIQTDAAINFGNSGGPLCNINGDVVGINTAMRAMAQGLGFATPINVARKILPQLREKGRVSRGYLGINVTNISPERRDAFSLPSVRGAFVEAVVAGEPAEKAGLQPGDVITQVDGQAVNSTRDLIDYVSEKGPGAQVRITLLRNGQQRTVTATTKERPASLAPDGESESGPDRPAQNRLGVSVQQITPMLRRQFGLGDDVQGVVITSVREVSPAGEAGLQPGDVITQVNGQPLTSTEQFRRSVEQARSGQYLRLYVTRYTRGGRSQSFFATPKIP